MRWPAAQRGLDLVVLVHACIVPGDIHGFSRLLGQNRFEEFGNLASPLVVAGEDHRLAAMLVDGSRPIAPRRLHRGRDYHLPSLRSPHRSQGWIPADVELVSVVEVDPCFKPLQASSIAFFDSMVRIRAADRVLGATEPQTCRTQQPMDAGGLN